MKMARYEDESVEGSEGESLKVCKDCEVPEHAGEWLEDQNNCEPGDCYNENCPNAEEDEED